MLIYIERNTPMRESHSPPPGHYNVAEDLTRVNHVELITYLNH
jgi:hypothetical protein